MDQRNDGKRTGENVFKRTFKRFRYADDYRRTTYVGANGRSKERITYIGSWFCITNDAAEYRGIALRLRVFTAIAALATLGALFSIPAPLEHKWYAVVLTLSLFPIAYAIMGAVRLPNKPEPIERQRYDKSVVRMKHSAIANLVICALTAIGLIVYWVLYACGVIAAAPYALGDGIFLGCLVLAAAMNLLLVGTVNKITTEVRENSAYRPA